MILLVFSFDNLIDTFKKPKRRFKNPIDSPLHSIINSKTIEDSSYSERRSSSANSENSRIISDPAYDFNVCNTSLVH